MVSHLVLPYEWVECQDGGTCERIAHVSVSAGEANSMPVEWLKELLGGNCDVGERYFAWLHETGGFFHREDGVAVESIGGLDFRYVNGVKVYDESFSRISGSTTLTRQWFSNGTRHRVDGPAVVHSNGAYKWFMNGAVHRNPDDGPAVRHMDGTYEWWAHDELQSGKRFHRWWWALKAEHPAVNRSVVAVTSIFKRSR